MEIKLRVDIRKYVSSDRILNTFFSVKKFYLINGILLNLRTKCIIQ